MKHIDKKIGFSSDMIRSILQGSKTLTYRIGDRWDFLEIGDSILAENSDTGKEFAELEIISKEKGTFGTLRDDIPGHKQNRTKEERRADFSKYYNREIKDEDLAIILGFRVVRPIA